VYVHPFLLGLPLTNNTFILCTPILKNNINNRNLQEQISGGQKPSAMSACHASFFNKLLSDTPGLANRFAKRPV
jgi:hypothetical protein